MLLLLLLLLLLLVVTGVTFCDGHAWSRLRHAPCCAPLRTGQTDNPSPSFVAVVFVVAVLFVFLDQLEGAAEVLLAGCSVSQSAKRPDGPTLLADDLADVLLRDFDVDLKRAAAAVLIDENFAGLVNEHLNDLLDERADVGFARGSGFSGLWRSFGHGSS